MGTQSEEFHFVFLKGENPENVTYEIQMNDEMSAPVEVGDQMGVIIYRLGLEELGRIPICVSIPVERAGYGHYFEKMLQEFLLRQETHVEYTRE